MYRFFMSRLVALSSCGSQKRLFALVYKGVRRITVIWYAELF